jgi:hypothetical protein
LVTVLAALVSGVIGVALCAAALGVGSKGTAYVGARDAASVD